MKSLFPRISRIWLQPFLAVVALILSACGRAPLEPAERLEIMKAVLTEVQEIRRNTNHAIELPEYVLRMQYMNATIDQSLKKADEETAAKMRYYVAPWNAALEIWTRFQGPPSELMPTLVEQWKIGAERARELQNAIRELAAEVTSGAEGGGAP
ncbi:MAG: hypothetical protein LBK99_11895 [Opitutaceae bacterium]|jgi:hypothetical protein|nr:hypothetical protein [Opitutaceae bacterium]